MDAGDLDLQAIEMQKPVQDQDLAEFDLDDSGAVDIEDRREWIEEIKNTWFHDANLDLEFNNSDLVQVFARGKYETMEAAGWEEGDFHADLVFDSGDLVGFFNGYEQGRRMNAEAVPEPGGWVTLLIAAFLLTARRRV